MKRTFAVLLCLLSGAVLESQSTRVIATDQITLRVPASYQSFDYRTDILDLPVEIPKFDTSKPFLTVWTIEKNANFEDTLGYSTSNFREIEQHLISGSYQEIHLDFGESQIYKMSGTAIYEKLIFSRFSSDDRTIERIVFVPTKASWIIIKINGAYLGERVFQELSNYFMMQNGYLVWNYKDKDKEGNDALRRCYKKTISGTIESKTLKQWYEETSKIIQSLVVKN